MKIVACRLWFICAVWWRESQRSDIFLKEKRSFRAQRAIGATRIKCLTCIPDRSSCWLPSLSSCLQRILAKQQRFLTKGSHADSLLCSFIRHFLSIPPIFSLPSFLQVDHSLLVSTISHSIRWYALFHRFYSVFYLIAALHSLIRIGTKSFNGSIPSLPIQMLF